MGRPCYLGYGQAAAIETGRRHAQIAGMFQLEFAR
jgi:hypothetical protein